MLVLYCFSRLFNNFLNSIFITYWQYNCRFAVHILNVAWTVSLVYFSRPYWKITCQYFDHLFNVVWCLMICYNERQNIFLSENKYLVYWLMFALIYIIIFLLVIILDAVVVWGRWGGAIVLLKHQVCFCTSFVFLFC